MADRMFLRCLLALLCLGAVLAWSGRHTDIDLDLADAMFDFSSGAFPWREHWFTAGVMHHAMKALFLGIALVPAAVLLADAGCRWQLLDRRLRRNLLIVAASSIAVPSVISMLKMASMHHCPWSLSRYGGFAPYLRIFDSLPPGMSAGHCFPAGHASGALWLASVAVFWLPQRPAMALAAFGAGLVPGLTLGWMQQIRGAHFLSHTLWSAWIAALVILVLVRLLCPAQPLREGVQEYAVAGR